LNGRSVHRCKMHSCQCHRGIETESVDDRCGDVWILNLRSCGESMNAVVSVRHIQIDGPIGRCHANRHIHAVYGM